MTYVEFSKFLKRGGRSESAIIRSLNFLDEFETFLVNERTGVRPDAASVEDLEAFIEYVEQDPKRSAKLHLWALRYYYQFVGNYDMERLCSFLRQQRITRKPFNLRDFRGVNLENTARLEEHGIRTTSQMLSAGKTPADRKSLSIQTGVPEDKILELVKLSDISRIPGIKGIRARLYYDAGADTVEKIAAFSHEDLLTATRSYVDRSGFDGIAPLPAEARHAIITAGKLPRVIEY